MDPMLATATSVLPTGAQWTYEFKWDGVRTLLESDAHGVRLTSRLGNDVTGGYPELAAQFADAGDLVLDGEIVAFVDGRPSFERLQSRMHARGRRPGAALVPVTYVVFDVLRAGGDDLTARPLHDRRAALETLAADHPDWTLSPVFDDAAATESVAREQGLEGVVAKRLDTPYRPGARSADWRKLRFLQSGDFVVIGWEAAAEHPRTLSSLLLAVHGPGGLTFAGKVGSGVAGRAATAIAAQLHDRPDPALAAPPPPSAGRHAHWVEPQLVVEVQFAERTADGRLRQPVFRGLRPDKTAEEAIG